jgi:hypothetical protein
VRLQTVCLLLGAQVLIMTASMMARSQGLFEKLVMPGPLAGGHAHLEKDCNSCHEPFTHKSQTALCLACHKTVAADRQAARGFHGRDYQASKAECKACHTEHKGRAFDITQLNRETFNHALTNFPLLGAHRRAGCDSCHAKERKFREAEKRCVGCHGAGDPHKGRLGQACEACHGEEAWRQVKPFDHGKTRFPLAGAHRDVACAQCHAGERYKDLPRACVSCHSLQDKHAGRYGDRCQTCHAPTRWAAISFDHDKATKFALRGAHARITCERCHTGDLYRDKLATTCVSCHRRDDPHKGQLGGNCGQCHGETAWRQKVAFDHDLTRFPLIGLHAVVPCEECHRAKSFKDAPSACGACHRDAHHDGRLGSGCAGCHNPNGWARWRFDHDTETSYPLTGAHRGLHCHACHNVPKVVKVSAPTGCYDCHSRDDAHQGAFGLACEKCHNTASFKQGPRGR